MIELWWEQCALAAHDNVYKKDKKDRVQQKISQGQCALAAHEYVYKNERVQQKISQGQCALAAHDNQNAVIQKL